MAKLLHNLNEPAVKFLKFLREKTEPGDRLGYSFYNYAELWGGDPSKCKSAMQRLGRTPFVKKISNSNHSRYVITNEGLEFLENNGGGK